MAAINFLDLSLTSSKPEINDIDRSIIAGLSGANHRVKRYRQRKPSENVHDTFIGGHCHKRAKFFDPVKQSIQSKSQVFTPRSSLSFTVFHQWQFYDTLDSHKAKLLAFYDKFIWGLKSKFALQFKNPSSPKDAISMTALISIAHKVVLSTSLSKP